MSQKIYEWIESGKNLPVISGSIASLMSLIQSDAVNISQIADVIKRDVGLSAAILRITNSSAFGLLRKITSIDQAVVLLGHKVEPDVGDGHGPGPHQRRKAQEQEDEKGQDRVLPAEGILVPPGEN